MVSLIVLNAKISEVAIFNKMELDFAKIRTPLLVLMAILLQEARSFRVHVGRRAAAVNTVTTFITELSQIVGLIFEAPHLFISLTTDFETFSYVLLFIFALPAIICRRDF